MENKNNKPNKKTPRLRGPIVVNSWPNIHDNNVSVRIHVGNVNFGMGSDRLKPNRFPISDVCCNILENSVEEVTNTCSKPTIISRPRRRRRSQEERLKNMTASIKSQTIENEIIGSESTENIRSFLLGLGLGIVSIFTFNILIKKG